MKVDSTHLVHLVRSALATFATDREAARRCLIDASALLEGESEVVPTVAQPPRIAIRPGGLAFWQAKKSLAYIDANLESKIMIRDMADLLGLCESHFSRAFKRSIGYSPMRYVCMRRVERVKLMIASERQPLSDIATACGFADQSHLTRVFGRAVGVSPGVWRRCAETAKPMQEYSCHL